MRILFWSILLLVLGFSIGLSIPDEPKSISVRSSTNYVNLACLYTLSKSFERLNGRLPSRLDELKAWCYLDETRRVMMDRVYYVQNSSGGTQPWIINNKQENVSGDDVFINSGPIYSVTSQAKFNIYVSHNGDIKVQNDDKTP